MTSLQDDIILPFQIDANAFRGRIVRLSTAVDDILSGHDYPAPVSELLGQTLAAAAALAGALKYEGIFTLQVQGDGPVSLLVADVTSEGNLRGYARFDEARLAAINPVEVAGNEVPMLLGKGYIAFTVDQGPDTDRYQGIVELSGHRVEDCVVEYFRKSEQLPTELKLAISNGQGWRASALLLQRMPMSGHSPIYTAEEVDEAWNRAVILMKSATDGELVSAEISGERMLNRLFHAEDLIVHEGQDLRARCRCSEERVRGTLKSFPREEVETMRDEAGEIVVVCEFCKTRYAYGAPDLDKIYG